MTPIEKIIQLLSFFILMAFFPFRICGLEASLSVSMSDQWAGAQLQAYDFENDKIIDSLEEGLTAQIFFQFRVYYRNRGFFSLFGDKLVLEKRFSYSAYKDFFVDQYVMHLGDGYYIYFDTVDEFLIYFFFITDDRLIEAHRVNSDDNYVLARVSINPVKLEPPLHIISLFSSIRRTSGWVESSIGNPERDDP